MLSCKDEKKGFLTYHCKKCNEVHIFCLGCNSRICSRCGKRYADDWAESLVENTFDVPHKHIIFGLPPALWAELRCDRKAWKVVMDAVIETMKWFYGLTCSDVKPGVIIVAHPFGKDVQFKFHVHGIVTKGGFDNKGKFIEWTRFVPFEKLHKQWMWFVCEALKRYFPKTERYSKLFDMLWAKYGNVGFYVNICKPTLRTKKELARYVARYVRHPAIADSRIMYFDDKVVAFYYIDTKTKRKVDVVMKIEEFMLALLQHIPDRQFKMIRHYGAYSRRTKKIYAKHLRRSINQCKPENLIKNSRIRCPKCGSIMEKVGFTRGKPPPDKNKLEAWV